MARGIKFEVELQETPRLRLYGPYEDTGRPQVQGDLGKDKPPNGPLGERHSHKTGRGCVGVRKGQRRPHLRE